LARGYTYLLPHPGPIVVVYVVESADARQRDDDAGGEPSMQQVLLGLLIPRVLGERSQRPKPRSYVVGRSTDLSDA
jgi:hypothetical protein